MSSPLSFPRYSFVQLAGTYSAPSCYPDPALCMPLSSPDHLRFFCSISGSGVATLRSIFPQSAGHKYLVRAAAVSPDHDCTPVVADYRGQNNSSGIFPPKPILTSDYIADIGNSNTVSAYVSQMVYNSSAYNQFDALTVANNNFAVPVGQCFKLAIYIEVLDVNDYFAYQYYAGCTNCFVRIADTECYTSVLAYHNRTAAFDFVPSVVNYFGDTVPVINSIELPMYLRDPLMTNEQKAYAKSDGSIVKIFERKEETFELETELMPYMWHKALDIALSHDYVQISNLNAQTFDPYNTAVHFAKKENYEIEYMKAPLSNMGKGHCKLSNAAAVHLINNNCE